MNKTIEKFLLDSPFRRMYVEWKSADTMKYNPNDLKNFDPHNVLVEIIENPEKKEDFKLKFLDPMSEKLNEYTSKIEDMRSYGFSGEEFILFFEKGNDIVLRTSDPILLRQLFRLDKKVRNLRTSGTMTD